MSSDDCPPIRLKVLCSDSSSMCQPGDITLPMAAEPCGYLQHGADHTSLLGKG